MSPDEMHTLQAQSGSTGIVIESPLLKAVFAVLMVLLVIAWIVSFWAYTEEIKSARASGDRFWLASAWFRAMNSKLYWRSIFAMLAIFLVVAGLVVVLAATGYG